MRSELICKEIAQACAGVGPGEFFDVLGLFALCSNQLKSFLRVSAFVDVNRYSPLIGGFWLGSLGTAPENGSTRHRSYFILTEGEDAPTETAEVS